jgi:hypothetical protein
MFDNAGQRRRRNFPVGLRVGMWWTDTELNRSLYFTGLRIGKAQLLYRPQISISDTCTKQGVRGKV